MYNITISVSLKHSFNVSPHLPALVLMLADETLDLYPAQIVKIPFRSDATDMLQLNYITNYIK